MLSEPQTYTPSSKLAHDMDVWMPCNSLLVAATWISFGMQMLCRTMYGAIFSVLDGCPLAPARYGYFVFDPGGGTM